MKNIHLLPTDLPSRLFIDIEDNKLKITIPIGGEHMMNQNIYITNNEEIKMDDWYLDDTNSVRQAITECESYWTHRKKYQKIILTTDTDLIKDGVQAIDDEFLEWFVKNPSCEWVEVGYGWIRLTETDNEGYWVSIPDKQFEMQQEEPKQETLEEAAENFVNSTRLRNNMKQNMTIEKWLSDVYYDEYGTQIWNKESTGDYQMVADVRGWGRIQNEFNKEEDAAIFQDNVGRFIAEAIREKIANTRKK